MLYHFSGYIMFFNLVIFLNNLCTFQHSFAFVKEKNAFGKYAF